MDIKDFKRVANAGYARVQIRGGNLGSGNKSCLSRVWGIVSRQRSRENKRVHDEFGKALMRKYGYAGELALSLRWGSAARTKLSSADIGKMIRVAQNIYKSNPKYRDSRLNDAGVVRRLDQFEALNKLDELKPGDILVKKIFEGTQAGAVEKAIVAVQGRFERDQVIQSEGPTELGVHRFPLLGSKSSEHAAIAVGDGQIAEADGSGVRQKGIQQVSVGTKYVVYRPKDIESAQAIGEMASELARVPEGQRIKYGLWGAIASSFRQAVNQNRAAADRVESGLRYSEGDRTNRMNLFCSEFAAMSIEMASMKTQGKMALGVNPRAVSPMVLEDLLNQRPDLFVLAGSYQAPGSDKTSNNES